MTAAGEGGAMRIVVAMLKHETNTFSPVPTPFERFAEWGAYFGGDVPRVFAGTRMPVAAYLRLVGELGAEAVTPVAAEAMPSGPVARDAFERLAGPIVDAVARGCDAVMLDLHGAMVCEHLVDGEGELLERVRRAAPGVPICVTCDFHANVSERMIAHCDALIGYKTYPHVDMYEVAEQVGRILIGKLQGRLDPVMAWGNRPLLSQTLRQGTDDEPMRGLIAMARAAEAEGILAATVFGGFPLADVPNAGVSSVVIADRDRGRAAAVRERLLDAAWARRDDFVYRGEPLGDAIARAKALPDGPVLLLDHADNVGSGGTSDVMAVIAEIVRQDLDDVAVAAVWDPVAVRQMAAAGVGATVTVALGGKTDMPSIGQRGQPLALTGKVRQLSDGEWTVRGPMYTGTRVFMGPSALFDTGKVQIVVVSRHHEPWDQGVFLSLGVDPRHKKYVVLKSRIHYRAGFQPIARHTITCDGTGVTTSDNAMFEFRHVRRPVFPLDRINEP